MLAITRLKASGLLSFGYPGIDIRPGPLAVLIGANGSGKTNVLRLLELLRLLAHRDERTIQGRPTVPEWKHESAADGDRPLLEVKLTGYEDGASVTHEMTFEDADGLLEVADERYTERTRAGSRVPAHEAMVAAARETYRRIRVSAAGATDERGAILDLLRNGDEEQARAGAAMAADADERLERSDDPVEDLRRAMTKLNAGDRLSTGAMRYVRRALEFSAGNGRISAIDHPETGCHPDLVARLANAAVDGAENGQFFITTHSRVVIDAMSEHADAVFVCERIGRRTTVEPLNLPHVNALLNHEALGTLWSRGQIGGDRW